MDAITTWSAWVSSADRLLAAVRRTLIALSIVLLAAAHANAATFIVNSTVDFVDATPGDGICADANGNCTLRAAIMEANALGGVNTITVPAGTYTLTIPGAHEDPGVTGDLGISSNLVISGAGAATTIIDGGALDRVIKVNSGTVTISGLTLRNGSASGTPTSSGAGGGIENHGTLTLRNVVVRDNATTADGGGLMNFGALTLDSTTVANNVGGGGAGIYSFFGSLTLVNSTISGNRSVGVSQCGFGGGGIWIYAGQASITNSTIFENVAECNPGAGGRGNAIAIEGGAAVTVQNSILASPSQGGVVCYAELPSSLGYNIAGDNSCALSAASDRNATDPQLGPLGDNGGPTPTHAPLNGSPAIDAIPIANCSLTVDQRGISRPQRAACDIGAVEAAPTVPGAPTIGTASIATGSQTATITWTAPASDGGSPITNYTITSNPGGLTGGANATATSGTVAGLSFGAAYTFTVTASNAVGTGAPSAASNSVTPATLPGAPIIAMATAGNGQIRVRFAPPLSDGGSPITSYVATCGTQSAAGAGSPITVNVTNGVSFACSVTATNSVGSGPASSASNTATPSLALPNALTGAVEVAAGLAHTCALMTSGGVKCWGNNESGQLGDGTTTARFTPVDTVGVNGATAIAAGDSHTCALISGGTVMCWGDDNEGALGNGIGTGSPTPTPITVSGLSGVTAIAAGYDHTCALTDAGTVKCWGRNLEGQLGDGSTQDHYRPVDVNGLTGVTAIAAGALHTCARINDGGMKCWGSNANGQLGDGTTVTRTTPVSVSGLSTVATLATASHHSCAASSDGSVACWGTNVFGQLGDGTTDSPKPTPVSTSGVTGIVELAAASSSAHACALSGRGTVKCWGDNEFGELGDGGTDFRVTAVDVAGVSGVTAIAVGSGHSCAVTDGGGVTCWGYNNYGQLGDGTTADRAALGDVLLAPEVSLPGAPTIGTASAGNAQISVAFTAPTSDGGSPITSYTATCGTQSASGAASPITVTGLTNGTSYTCTVAATNSVGTGPASAPSNSVTPAAPATLPGAPTIGTASIANGSQTATITWTAPASDGGSPITGYTITSNPGGLTGSAGAGATSGTVAGLSFGTAYMFTVTAINAVGPGAPSAASNSVTPATSTATTLTSNLNPSHLNDAVTLTATVSPSTATGTVTFQDGNTTLAMRSLSGGAATLTTSSLSGGTHSIRASYGGAAGYVTSSSNLVNQVVDAPPQVVSLAALDNSPTMDPSVRYQVTFTEKVKGVTLGNFELVTGGVTGATMALDGDATTTAAVRTVTVNTGRGSGSLQVNLKSGTGIVDTTGNALVGAPVSGAPYQVDKGGTVKMPGVGWGQPNAAFGTGGYSLFSTPGASDFAVSPGAVAALATGQILAVGGDSCVDSYNSTTNSTDTECSKLLSTA
jgi:CSLREA domain-containing protein